MKAINQLVGKSSNFFETSYSALEKIAFFYSYVNSFGGNFFSDDIKLNPMVNLLEVCINKSRFYRDVSLKIIRAMGKVCLKYSRYFNNFSYTYGIFSSKGALKLATCKLIDHYYQIVWRL